MMNQPKRIKVTDVNPFLICVLCGGYYVDATTIIECLHSFCRSCIVKYLEKNKYCPICDVQVHKSNPLLNIRNDKTLQTIVYKLVPSLFQNEMRRRADFYRSIDPLKRPIDPETRGEIGPNSCIILPDETVSICLEYANAPNSQNTQSYGKRYLHCPGAVTIAHLHRILRGKFSLTRRHAVQIYFKDDHLPESLSLIDLAYTYQWRRKGPIHLNYRILEMRRKWLKKEEESKGEKTLIEEKESSKKNEWKEVSVEINENGVLSVKGIESISTTVSNLVRNSELEVVPLDPEDNKTRTLEANKLSISRMMQPKGEALSRIVSKLSPNERLIGNTSVSIRAVPVSPPNPTVTLSTPLALPPKPSPVLSSLSLLKQVPTQNSVVVGNVTVSKEAPSSTREKDSIPRVSVSLTKEPHATAMSKPKVNKFKYKALHWNPTIDRNAIMKHTVDAKRTHKIFKSRNVMPFLNERVDGVKALYRVGEVAEMVSRCRPPPYAPGSPKRPLISPPGFISRIPSPAHVPPPASFSPYPHLFPNFPLPERFPPPDFLRSMFHHRPHHPMLPPPVQHIPPSAKAAASSAIPLPPHSVPTQTGHISPPSSASITTFNNNNNIASSKEFVLKPSSNPIST